ncbi:hypothetical protein UFOVP71_378 [uncultured Caudovirales phage]|uniref:Uncharacterized protein n=1 Tax=uncultured Caudovirales phage TaxID=2100421 RepID=A0A6J5TDV5_9CAUD|nr:hypothetical protein UFOVP71_378 [uncultured Caudovirales phage]
MFALLASVKNYVLEDWRENPLRCVLEILAWFMSIGCALTMAVTVPTPPFLILYPIFITQCVIFAWACKTRGSTGMLANYMLLVTIDSIALVKMWLQ